MPLDTKWEFRKLRLRDVRGQPHMDCQVFKDGKYHGYIDVHTHRVKDESISIGTTVRAPTKMRP